MRYVIVGAGIAGTTAAEQIRKIDQAADIVLIGSEQLPVYSRVLLPHYVKGKVEREKVFLKKGYWYEEHAIEFMMGVHATKIDTVNQFVETSEGREIPYDKLLITTGGEVNLIPEDKRGVSYFYTLSDADNLLDLIQQTLQKPESERHGLVYGGGFLALEYVNAFAEYGIHTTLLMRSKGFWSRFLSEDCSDILIAHAKQKGIDVLTGVERFSLQGADDLEGILLADGRELPADILGIGIGIHTDYSLFEDAGIETRGGVLADQFLQTNVPNVYAAGDIAEYQDPIVGRQLSYGNWMNAQMQGRAVAKTMTGEATEFNLVSSYATNLLGLEIVFVGDANLKHADKVVQLHRTDGEAIDVYERDGRTVGAVLIGNVKERMAITQAIKEQKRYERSA